uniref:Radical SAM core domain-containing protein n=1 Tax=Glossina pallidipes TaxID=7398 RepID=A0A1A9Z141_GLOPL
MSFFCINKGALIIAPVKKIKIFLNKKKSTFNNSWLKEFSNSITNPLDLLKYLRLDNKQHLLNGIQAIILSGGDPLMEKDKSLDKIISNLEAITHLTTLRIHTRMLTVIPNRITHFLRERKVVLLNQSVLLRNINDDALTLFKLHQKLFKIDRVLGASHFYVSENKAKKIMKKLLEISPGYLVPKLVKEIPGEKNKNLFV